MAEKRIVTCLIHGRLNCTWRTFVEYELRGEGGLIRKNSCGFNENRLNRNIESLHRQERVNKGAFRSLSPWLWPPNIFENGVASESPQSKLIERSKYAEREIVGVA